MEVESKPPLKPTPTGSGARSLATTARSKRSREGFGQLRVAAAQALALGRERETPRDALATLAPREEMSGGKPPNGGIEGRFLIRGLEGQEGSDA